MRWYIREHLDTWKRMEKEYGLRSGIADSDLAFKEFEYFLLVQFDFDRQYDMSKMLCDRVYGGEEPHGSVGRGV
jgi:hypothetical protein